MDDVPYQQPLTGHELQPNPNVPSGVPLVRPIGHLPETLPRWAAGLRSQAYPALLRVLRRGGYGHRGGPLTPQARSPTSVPRVLL